MLPSIYPHCTHLPSTLTPYIYRGEGNEGGFEGGLKSEGKTSGLKLYKVFPILTVNGVSGVKASCLATKVTKIVDTLKGRKVGRPSEFSEEKVRFAVVLAGFGATDAEISSGIGISREALSQWREKHPEFADALKNAKEVADNEVEKSLFQRAKGYSHPDTHFATVDGKVVATPTVKHYPPDTTACIFWLKNRRADRWRDVWKHEHSGPNGGPIQVEQMSAEELEAELVKRGALAKPLEFVGWSSEKPDRK